MRGLAPGEHVVAFRAFAGGVYGEPAYHQFVMPGPVARFGSIGEENFAGSSFTLTFRVNIPARCVTSARQTRGADTQVPAPRRS